MWYCHTIRHLGACWPERERHELHHAPLQDKKSFVPRDSSEETQKSPENADFRNGQFSAFSGMLRFRVFSLAACQILGVPKCLQNCPKYLWTYFRNHFQSGVRARSCASEKEFRSSSEGVSESRVDLWGGSITAGEPLGKSGGNIWRTSGLLLQFTMIKVLQKSPVKCGESAKTKRGRREGDGKFKNLHDHSRHSAKFSECFATFYDMFRLFILKRRNSLQHFARICDRFFAVPFSLPLFGFRRGKFRAILQVGSPGSFQKLWSSLPPSDPPQLSSDYAGDWCHETEG